MYTHIYIYNIHIYACIHVCTHTHAHIASCAPSWRSDGLTRGCSIYTHMCIHIYTYIFIHAPYIHICIYLYTHIHTHTPPRVHPLCDEMASGCYIHVHIHIYKSIYIYTYIFLHVDRSGCQVGIERGESCLCAVSLQIQGVGVVSSRLTHMKAVMSLIRVGRATHMSTLCLTSSKTCEWGRVTHLCGSCHSCE